METLWIALTLALGLGAEPAVAAQESRSAQPVSQAQADRAAAAAQRKDSKQGRLDDDDREFMEKAARLGHAELAASKLAASKASSQEVRDFAQQMVKDHTRSSKELQALASSKGVTLPTEPDRSHQRALKKLQGLSGAEFDREYMASAGVKDHDRTVDLFRDAHKDVKDLQVKAYIDKTLPALQKHHQRAKTVHASLKESKSSATGAGARSDTPRSGTPGAGRDPK